MRLLTPTTNLGKTELKLLFKLHFACLMSKHGDVMQDKKVIERSNDLIRHLKQHGISQQFKNKFIKNDAAGKYVGSKLGDHFHLSVVAYRNEVIITRLPTQRTAYVIEVSHA